MKLRRDNTEHLVMIGGAGVISGAIAGGFILGMMGSVLSSTMVNIAIPNIMGAYGIGQDQAHWMATAFFTTMPV